MLPTLCLAPSWEQGSYLDSPHGPHCPHCPPQSAAAAAPLHCAAYQSAVDWVRLRVSDRACAVCRVDTHTHTHTCAHVYVARADTGQDTEERILQLPPLPYQGRRQSLYRSCSSPLLCRHQGVLSSEAEIDSPSSSLRWIHLAPCTMRYAPCTMHHAPCTLHHAPRAS